MAPYLWYSLLKWLTRHEWYSARARLTPALGFPHHTPVHPAPALVVPPGGLTGDTRAGIPVPATLEALPVGSVYVPLVPDGAEAPGAAFVDKGHSSLPVNVDDTTTP